MATTQSYANHTRWHPLFHFFVLPVMGINFFWAVVTFVKAPDTNSGWWIMVSTALALLTFYVRTYSLRVQDRIIRLEERLRFQQILPAELCQQTAGIRTGQIIALRFAPDNELEELVREVISGRLNKPADIKQAVKNWRGDTFRV
jgi:hypothetical protein